MQANNLLFCDTVTKNRPTQGGLPVEVDQKNEK